MLTSSLAAFVDEAEEQGAVSEAALEAVAVELDLDEDESDALRAELESRDVVIEAEDEEPAVEELPELDLAFDPLAGGVPDSLTLFMNDIGSTRC